MKLFELFATLSLDTKQFDADITTATNKGKSLGDQLTGIVAKGTAAGNAMFSFGRSAVSAIWGFGKDLVQTAADVQAETAAYESTFKGMKAMAADAFGAVADDTGILATRLRTVGTKAFSQFKGAGMDATDALDMMENYLRYAADAAAYYDISLEDADARMRSFLRGNVEAGDAIGLFTSELQRNNKAMEVYGKAWKDLDEAQRQFVMMNIVEDIYGQAGVFGQAAAESDSYANQLANLSEAWRQVKATLGAPILEALIPVIEKFVQTLQENPELVETLADTLGQIAGLAFDGVIAALEFIRDNGSAIATAIQNVTDAANNLFGEVGGFLFGGSNNQTSEEFKAEAAQTAATTGQAWYGTREPVYDDYGKQIGWSDGSPYGGSNATGLNYVPYDNFRTRLHRGERILTAREAEEQDEQRAYGSRGIDYDRIAEAASQRPVVVYVDKKAAAVLMTREMDTAIGNRNIQQLVSMGG